MTITPTNAEIAERLDRIERQIGKISAELAWARTHTHHVHIEGNRDRYTTIPALRGSDDRPGPGPGSAIRVPAGRVALCHIWPAGKMPDDPDMERPRLSPVPAGVVLLGPGHHRVHPSMIPQETRDSIPEVRWPAADMHATYGGTPITQAHWRHADA